MECAGVESMGFSDWVHKTGLPGMLRPVLLALSVLGTGSQSAAAPSTAPAPSEPASAAPRDSAAPVYRGSAYDYENKVPAYTETQSERYRNGKHVSTHTVFVGAGGKPIAERTLDFSLREFDPDYLYKDLRNGYEEGARTEGADIVVHFRDSKNAERKEKRIKVPGPCIINGGVGKFVKSRWAEIAAGKKVSFNMVIPARLDFFRFEAYVDRKYSLKPEESNGREYLPVVIEPKNSVLSMLLPAIVMYENPATQRMVAYQGIVNVADAKGRSLRVTNHLSGPRAVGPFPARHLRQVASSPRSASQPEYIRSTTTRFPAPLSTMRERPTSMDSTWDRSMTLPLPSQNTTATWFSLRRASRGRKKNP